MRMWFLEVSRPDGTIYRETKESESCPYDEDKYLERVVENLGYEPGDIFPDFGWGEVVNGVDDPIGGGGGLASGRVGEEWL